MHIAEIEIAQEGSVNRSSGGEGLRLWSPEQEQVRRRCGCRESCGEDNCDRDRREKKRRFFQNAGRDCLRRRRGILALGRQSEPQQECRRGRQRNEDDRLPANAGEREGGHPPGDEDRAGREGEADPARQGEAAIARVSEQGPTGHGKEAEARQPEVTGLHGRTLLQTVPRGISRRNVPGEGEGVPPATMRKSASDSRPVGTPQSAAGTTFLPGRRATASR